MRLGCRCSLAAHEACTAHSKKELLEQWAKVGGAAVAAIAILTPVGALVGWAVKLFRNKRETGSGLWPNTNVNVNQVTLAPQQNVTVSLPDRRPLVTEGDILGAFHDLPPDQRKSLYDTLTKLHGAPSGETKAEQDEVIEAVEEAFEGDLTDIQEVLNRRYQRLATEAGSVDKALAEAARDLAAVVFPTNRGKALALYREATERDPEHFWGWVGYGRAARDCGGSLEATEVICASAAARRKTR